LPADHRWKLYDNGYHQINILDFEIDDLRMGMSVDVEIKEGFLFDGCYSSTISSTYVYSNTH
jgi:hypothetical protein